MNIKTIAISLITIAAIALTIQAVMDNKKSDSRNAQIENAEINDLGLFENKNREEAVQRFLGKPTVVFMVGTFCPYCQNAMPKYKTDIWDVYKDKINIFANVIDGEDGKRFNVPEIPQGYDERLDFKNLTDQKCDYVPSWVLLDKNGDVIDMSCGASKSIDELIANIEKQLEL